MTGLNSTVHQNLDLDLYGVWILQGRGRFRDSEREKETGRDKWEEGGGGVRREERGRA